MARKAKRDLTIEEQLARGPVDLPFLMLVVLLTVIGLIMLLSASYAAAYYDLENESHHDPFYYARRQAIFAALGFVVMFVVSKIDYQRYRWLSVFALIGSIFLLVLVITPLGVTVNGATRWLKLGLVAGPTYQPSELAKIAIIMFFAARLSKRDSQLKAPKQYSKRTTLGRFLNWGQQVGLLELFYYGCVLGIVLLLLALEHHMSGMILMIIGAASVLFASGVRLYWFVGGGSAIAALLVLIITQTDYMTDRIIAWQDPWAVYYEGGYQVIQSQIAIGSGGLLGLGLGTSRQKFLYLPEEHNDFIFAIVCEELGLVGACVILALFALLIIRAYWLAIHARDRFGTLLVVGITTLFAFQVFLNIGVVTGLLPTTGISLPFFSYGGTALVIHLAEMGIILGVSRQIPAKKEG